MLKARLIAESVHRVWLYAGSSLDFGHTASFERAWKHLDIPETVITAILEWGCSQHSTRDHAPPAPWLEWADAQLRQELGTLLQGWQEADGIIPFIAPPGEPNDCLRAVGLPFRIRDNVGTHGPHAVGCRGQPCGLDLNEGVEAAIEMARRAGWIGRNDCFAVEMTTLEGSCDFPVSGASCGLPVALARGLRAEGLRVPVFQFAASGTLGSGGSSLAPHRDAETLSQKETLLRSFGVKQVILPGGGPTRWPCGEDLTLRIEDLFARLTPVAQSDAHDALLQKVSQHAEAMHRGHQPAELVERLIRKTIADSLPDNDSRLTDVRAEALLTLSAAMSHLGRPLEARDASRQALELAQRLPSSWRGLALARSAVILQDLGEYEAAMENCEQALSVIHPFQQDLESLELDMKVSGTKGQLLTYWGLGGPDPSRSLEALRLLEHARQCAQKIDARRRHLGEPEEPRNAAYLFLWHALHAPGQAAEAWQNAWAAAEKLDLSRTSQQYLLRHRWLAVYRSMLVEGKAPGWMHDAEDLGMPGSGWLFGTALKYRGTWHAFEGRAQAASDDFDNAVRQFRHNHEGISLFDFFAATTSLQAGESLQPLDPDRSAAFFQQALALFEQCEVHQSWFSGRPFAGSIWKERTRARMAGRECMENPQLHYPY
ncbi:hypothetical protein GCM10023213_39110 [Prosthecobacter algae]|uniref:Tetratricopeptide repeat protein n=1 Tax=Prosthecobacter algae TaxID=1144682 RepID=A0ABP9PHM8_9BACT